MSVTKRIVESDAAVSEVKVCTAALRLLLQILNWDFRYNSSSKKNSINVFVAGVRQEISPSKRSECIVVQVRKFFCFKLQINICGLLYIGVGILKE